MTHSRGFISLGFALLIVIGIAALGGAGWWANKHIPNKLDQAVGQTASTTSQVSAQPSAPATHETKGEAMIKVTAVQNPAGPTTITLSYANLPARTTALAVCGGGADKGCTEWVEDFKPTGATGAYVMSSQKAFGPQSTKGLGNGTYKIVVIGANFSDQIVASPDFSVPFAAPAFQTYTNTKYGFSLEYPAATPVHTKDYASEPTIENPPEAYFIVCGDADTDCGTHTKDLVEGYLLVSIAPDTAANAGVCRHAGKEVNLNGVTFREFDYPLAGHDSIARDWVTVKNGLCYDLHIFMFQSAGVLAHATPNWEDAQMYIYARYAPIIQSFRFTN